MDLLYAGIAASGAEAHRRASHELRLIRRGRGGPRAGASRRRDKTQANPRACSTPRGRRRRRHGRTDRVCAPSHAQGRHGGRVHVGPVDQRCRTPDARRIGADIAASAEQSEFCQSRAHAARSTREVAACCAAYMDLHASVRRSSPRRRRLESPGGAVSRANASVAAGGAADGRRRRRHRHSLTACDVRLLAAYSACHGRVRALPDPRAQGGATMSRSLAAGFRAAVANVGTERSRHTLDVYLIVWVTRARGPVRWVVRDNDVAPPVSRDAHRPSSRPLKTRAYSTRR